MHDDTQNQKRDKAEKHAQENERGESLKACTQNDEWRFANYDPSKTFSRFSTGMQCMMTPKIRKEAGLKSILQDMKEVRA